MAEKLSEANGSRIITRLSRSVLQEAYSLLNLPPVLVVP